MSVFDAAEFAGHELVVHCTLGATGAQAILAVHDRTLGPALGGCRMWPYASEPEALADVLRLSRGMTFKNALAGLALGGGKAVIRGDPARDRSEALWRAFADCVDALGGRYWTAQDVGVELGDMVRVAGHTRYVAGFDRRTGEGRDPSAMTALGTFHGIRAAVRHRLGAESLQGIRVLVQGLGHVGGALCRHLHGAGASLLVSDLDARRAEALARELEAEAVAPEAVYETPADVYAPCALGATLNAATIPVLRAAVVAGAANNQLAVPEAAGWLGQRGILYAPDYAINAGGVIDVGTDALPDADRADVAARVAGIVVRDTPIFERSPPARQAALPVEQRMALERLGQSPVANTRSPPSPRDA